MSTHLYNVGYILCTALLKLSRLSMYILLQLHGARAEFGSRISESWSRGGCLKILGSATLSKPLDHLSTCHLIGLPICLKFYMKTEKKKRIKNGRFNFENLDLLK